MIIIEGIDGTGKTTLKNGLSLRGFCSQNFDYDTMTPDIFKKYCGVISAGNEKSVLERSFISEVVYGTCIRKHSRISSYQFDKLASMCAEKNTVVIYLYAAGPDLSSGFGSGKAGKCYQ